jgi:glycosyltransferase involved in cell wall biosynthesis
MEKREVVIFAGALFDSVLWTNRQQIAVRLAQRGWKVIYVEPRLFWLRMLLGKFPGKNGKWRWFYRSHFPWHVQKNLVVISQINIVPWSREKGWVSWLNHAVNKPIVMLHVFLRGFRDPAVLIYDTEAAQYLKNFPYSKIVYDCVDDHGAQAGVDRNSKRVAEEEKLIAARADAVSVTTQILYERFAKLNNDTVLNSNAADVSKFIEYHGEDPLDVEKIARPRIGTVGALDDYKIDSRLLMEVAKAKVDWQFILVGPQDYATNKDNSGGISELKKLSNVHFLGAKRADEVPAYVSSFDVAMIPYRESKYNNASFPLKFWEFMASGKPIVVSGLPELAKYKTMIAIAGNSSEFIEGIEKGLKDSSEERKSRVAEAMNHDWSARVDVIESLLV